MALTSSQALSLGTQCPDFTLKGVDGVTYALQDFEKSQGLLVAFICAHCPYVLAIEDRLIALARAYQEQDLQVVAICSNDPARYIEDSAPYLLKRWHEKRYGFPYLIDDTQSVAKKFQAVCTPDLYLFDQDRLLYYHGQLDNNWKTPEQVTRQDLKEAIDGLLAHLAPPAMQVQSIGCSIKWKPALSAGIDTVKA